MASPSEELQKAVFLALTADAAIAAMVGGNVHDGRPGPGNSITLGPADHAPVDMEGVVLGVHGLQIDVWFEDGGRLRKAKAMNAHIKRVLHRARLPLETHALATLAVTLSRAVLDPDGLTAHGITQVEAEVEER